MKKPALVSAATFALIFGLSACASEPAATDGGDDPTVNSQETAQESSAEGEDSGAETAEASEDSADESKSDGQDGFPENDPIDRTATPWDADFPADFPLEDIPFPDSGSFDYAELVEEDVWNVMISDISNEDHEAWLAKMDSMFKNMDEDGIYFIGKGGASETVYGVRGIVFDSTDTTVTIAYRISM